MMNKSNIQTNKNKRAVLATISIMVAFVLTSPFVITSEIMGFNSNTIKSIGKEGNQKHTVGFGMAINQEDKKWDCDPLTNHCTCDDPLDCIDMSQHISCKKYDDDLQGCTKD